jgi:hypothetical protein
LKQITSILLLFIFLHNAIGVGVIFKLQQQQVRREIKRQLRRRVADNELRCFNLSKSDYRQLNWVRLDDEFQLEHEMFDVVRKEQKNDSVFLFCINDKQEARLFAGLAEIFKRSADSNAPAKRAAKKLFKFFTTVYLKAKDESVFNEHQFSKLNSRYCSFYSSPPLIIESPPPQLIQFSV